jgi:hypothetical protein
VRGASVPGLVLLLVVAGCRPAAVEPPEQLCEIGAVVGGVTEPAAVEPVVPVRKRAWEESLGGTLAARPWVRARLAGWPSRTRVDARTLPRDDAAFARRVAADTWRGLEGMTDREHHLPIDHVHLDPRDASVPPVGDYTNVTNVGLMMIALAGATDLGLVTPADAAARLAAMLDTLERLETDDGLFFNYYDTTTLERTSHLLSFVDTAWLAAGLIVARQSVPALAPRLGAILARFDWRRFYDPGAGRMRHGWWVTPGEPSRYHYGVLYAESRLGSVIAIGSGQVPEAHWFRMARTFPAACTWQTQAPQGRHEKTVRGQTFVGGWYVVDGTRVVPSWGGSMFEALMPTLVLDELRLAPASLGDDDRRHVALQQRVATRDLGLPVWGLSPALRPDGAGYGEYGVRALGMLGYPAGAVTPHASALAVAVDPAGALGNLRTIATRWDAYGDWGFYDAVDPATGAVARSYLVLDQAMTFIALANHLCQGCLQRRFAADPLVAPALPVIAAEHFFD